MPCMLRMVPTDLENVILGARTVIHLRENDSFCPKDSFSRSCTGTDLAERALSHGRCLVQDCGNAYALMA